MKTFRPFRLNDVNNNGDDLIPVEFKCCRCNKPCKATLISIFLDEIKEYPNITCLTCNPNWLNVMIELGREERDNRCKLYFAQLRYPFTNR